LHLESSVNEEPFYAAWGYHVERRGVLRIAPGVATAAVTTRKRIRLFL
jgi:hypothetical protein